MEGVLSGYTAPLAPDEAEFLFELRLFDPLSCRLWLPEAPSQEQRSQSPFETIVGCICSTMRVACVMSKPHKTKLRSRNCFPKVKMFLEAGEWMPLPLCEGPKQALVPQVPGRVSANISPHRWFYIARWLKACCGNTFTFTTGVAFHAGILWDERAARMLPPSFQIQAVVTPELKNITTVDQFGSLASTRSHSRRPIFWSRLL